MVVFLMTSVRLVKALWRGLRDPEFRALLCLVAVLLLSGVLFYSRVEGWSAIDSLYFSVTTLATVGYGDLAPTTAASKIFTVVYIVLGIGVLMAFAVKVAHNVLEGRQELTRRLARRRTDRDDAETH